MGRRAHEHDDRDHSSTTVDEVRKHMRRERNKEAAARCRKRKADLTDRLHSDVLALEAVRNAMEKEIHSLRAQKEELDFTLRSHLKICEMQQREGLVAAATKIAPSPASPSASVTASAPMAIARITHLMLPPVVTSTSVGGGGGGGTLLPLPRRPPLSLTLTKVEGVSIETPSTVVPNISFDLDTPGASSETLPAVFKTHGEQESDDDSES